LNNNLNILIIEDELLIAEMLKEMLLELNYKVAGIAKNYVIAADVLKRNDEINFAILDINLSETKTGLDVAQLINSQHKIPFIFLTSYSDKKTFKEAIELKPEAYLIKPFSKMDLFTTLEIIKLRTIDTERTVVIKDGHLSVKVKLSAILWLKSENVYVEVKTTEKTYVVRNSLDKFLEELAGDVFFRIHRSYAVNVNHVKAVNGQYVLIGEEKIPLSRKLRDELLVRFSA
jgi:DNA-binding LytR/AlgR family response regulator